MTRRQIIVYIVVFCLLVLLGIHEYHSNPQWRNFSWTRFRGATEDAKGSLLILAVVMIYVGYLLRALRWRLLMVPKGRFGAVLKGTIIGFTGVALFGRPGELVRPFYIARKHRSTLSPQLAAWILERVLDMVAVVLIVGADLALASDVMETAREADKYTAFEIAGIGMLCLVAALVAALILFHRSSARIVRWAEERHWHSHAMQARIVHFLRSLQLGMQPVTRVGNLLVCMAYTIVMWLGIGVGIWFVLRAYADLPSFTFAEALLIFGFTLAGSAIQLPFIGGGAQLGTLGALGMFDAEPTVAASAALLIWLISFYAITPIGAAVAAKEGISWRRLEEEALATEAAEETAEPISQHGQPAT